MTSSGFGVDAGYWVDGEAVSICMEPLVHLSTVLLSRTMLRYADRTSVQGMT